MTAGDLWFFERVAPVYDYLMPGADAAALAAGLDRAGRPVERVLDVGGGTGRASRALDVPDRTVVDASGSMLARVPPGIGRVRGDARRLPVADGAVDAVLVVDAYHHLPEPVRVAAEAARVLAPGGVLVAAEFDPSTPRGRLLAAGEHLIGMESRFREPADLVASLDGAGLDAGIVDRGFGYAVAGRKPGP